MILAAGLGERMRPLTDSTPKPLLEVAGKPLIQYHVENLVAAGFTELVVNVSWLAEQIVDFLDSGDWGCRFHWSREPEPLETAGGIIQALPLLGDEPFALVNGDIWTDYPLERLRARERLTPGAVHLVLVDNPPQHPAGDFWLAEDGCLSRDELPSVVSPGRVRPGRDRSGRDRSGRDRSGRDRPGRARSDRIRLTYAGIGVYHPGLFAGSRPGKQPLLPFLESSMREGRAGGEYYSGQWEDVGTPARLRALDARLAIH